MISSSSWRTPWARIRFPFSRAQRLSKTVGEEPPGPNRTLGCRRLRCSRWLLVPAPLAASEISATPLEPGFPAPLVSDAGRFNLGSGCARFSLSVSFVESAARIPSKLNRKMITGARMCGFSHALSAVRHIVDGFLKKYPLVSQEACEAG